MGMDRKGNRGEKWLRYRVCEGCAISLVECEIEVLYAFSLLGMLEKMKMHPGASNARKSTKSGVCFGRLAGCPLALDSFAALWLWPACYPAQLWPLAVLCLAAQYFVLQCCYTAHIFVFGL